MKHLWANQQSTLENNLNAITIIKKKSQDLWIYIIMQIRNAPVLPCHPYYSY